jgi:hypothetical protein
VSIRDNVAAITEKVIREYNPTFALGGHGAIYPQWLPDLTLAGFENLATFSFEETRVFNHEQWRNRIMASAAALASLDAATAADLDRELTKTLAQHFGSELLEVPHRSWTVIARKPLAQ